MERNIQIDLIKGLAIISVIILHSLPSKILYNVGAPFYIWQAVPIFMIIAGLNSSQSYIRKDLTYLRECYTIELIFRGIRKIIIPFSIIWIAEITLLFLLKGKIISARTFIEGFLLGGWGQGSYFIPIMFQHYFIFPAMYWLSQKYGSNRMLVIVFGFDMFLELISFEIGIPSSSYRNLYFRYLFAVALGIWLATSKNLNRKVLLIGTAISGVYIYAVGYLGFRLPIEPSWASQNAPSFMWPFMLIILGFKFLPSCGGNIVTRIIALLGRASFHIFLIQMVFFYFRYEVPLLKSLRVFPGIMANLIVTITLGIVFFHISQSKKQIVLKKG